MALLSYYKNIFLLPFFHSIFSEYIEIIYPSSNIIMLLLFLVSHAVSRRFERNITYKDEISMRLSGYDEAFLIFDPGEALMMVEWEDAIITFDIGSESAKITKYDEYSFFTFKDKTNVTINFHSPISFFTLPSPYKKSSDGAYLYISNIENNEINIPYTRKDIYLSAYSPYDLYAEFEKKYSGKFTFYYYTDSPQNTTNVTLVDFSEINYLSIFQSEGLGQLRGSLEINSTQSYMPTVPTSIRLSFNSVKQDTDCFPKNNNAYKGSFESYTTTNILDFNRNEYVFISHDLKPQLYSIYVNNSKGEILQLNQSQVYSEILKRKFSVDVYVNSSECGNLTYIESFNSSEIEMTSNGYLQIERITINSIPEECVVYDPEDLTILHKNAKKAGIIVSILMASLVAAAVIIAAIVLIVVRARKNKTYSRNENDDNDDDESTRSSGS